MTRRFSEAWAHADTQGLSQQEKDYLAKRNPGIKTGITNMVTKAGIPEPPRTPVIALSLSGGGYRAMM